MPPTDDPRAASGRRADAARPALVGSPRGAAPGAGDAAARPQRSGSTRAMPTVLLALAGALLAARVALGIFEHVRPVERADQVEWREPAAGEAEARSGGRLVLYFFTRDGEPRCRQMGREVFGDPRAAAGIEAQFVPIRVLDLSREEGRNPPDVARLVQAYAVEEFPTLVVAPPGGPRFEKQAGYPGAQRTARFLARATARMMLPAPRARPPASRDTAGTGR